jgi:polysaccharide pyruvyl transferase WcaK-like protein
MTFEDTKNETKAFEVCLMGASLGTNNMGVSALAASLVKIIHGIRPDAVFHLLVGDKSVEPKTLVVNGTAVTVNIVNFRMSPRARFHEHLFSIFMLACIYRLLPLKWIRRSIVARNKWIRTLTRADFIGEIRGGDSFSDIYGLKRLILGVMPALTALILKKDLVLLPQTYGPYKSATARALARFIIKRARSVASRDREGMETVRTLLKKGPSENGVVFCPDVAFMLDSIPPENPAIEPPLDPEKHRPLVGINVNGLMYYGGYSRKNMFGLKLDYGKFITALIDRFLEETDAHILLVPHTFGAAGNVNSDPAACAEALGRIDPDKKSRVHLVTEQYDQNNIKGVIGLCDFFVGSRMHSCIAAISQEIPTVAVAYSKKFIGVFNSADLGEMVADARTLDTGEAIDAVFDHFGKRGEHAERISGRIASLKENIGRVFNKLVKV